MIFKIKATNSNEVLDVKVVDEMPLGHTNHREYGEGKHWVRGYEDNYVYELYVDWYPYHTHNKKLKEKDYINFANKIKQKYLDKYIAKL